MCFMTIRAVVLILLAWTWPVHCGARLRIFVVDSAINKTVDSCYAEPASFGPVQLFGRFLAYPVVADPPSGCSEMRPPPYRRNDTARWAALVDRDRPGPGACYFDRKVMNAQSAGFGAAIVVNYADSLSGMDASDHGGLVLIPVAMVTERCGIMLRQYARFDGRFHLKFWLAYPLDFRAYVIPFITIVSVCFAFFTALWVAKWYRDWQRRQKNRLTRASLKRLRQKKFDPAADPYECCAICLEDYVQGDKLRILPCNHAYHQACIDPWLLKSRSVCPVCKRRVFPRSSGGGESSEEEGGGDGGERSPAAAQPVAATDNERTPLLPGGSGSSGTFENPGPSQNQRHHPAAVNAPTADRQRDVNRLV